jgi:hypothetical protein
MDAQFSGRESISCRLREGKTKSMENKGSEMKPKAKKKRGDVLTSEWAKATGNVFHNDPQLRCFYCDVYDDVRIVMSRLACKDHYNLAKGR